MLSYWQWIHGSMLGRSFDEACFFEVSYFLFRMKKVSFFGLVASFLLVGGVFFLGEASSAQAQACNIGIRNGTCIDATTGTCASGVTAEDILHCTNANDVCCAASADRCTDTAGKSCSSMNSCVTGSSIGVKDCTGGLTCCTVASSGTSCTYNGQSGKCIGEGEVCNGTAGKGNCSDANATCCVSNAATACTGGGCKATCATGESEDTTCTLSQCTGSMKYCKSSTTTPGGGTTTAVKCDPAKFKEYAGVCFPLNTGLSETSVASIIINLMKWMLYLFGFLAIIAFVISGLQYLSAAGNMNMIETAKRNMNYSVIGVIVALSGLVILIAVDSLLRATGWGG